MTVQTDDDEVVVFRYKLRRTNLDLVASQDKLSRGAIKLFYWLGDRVYKDSMCKVDTKDICSYFGIDKSKTSRLLCELEEGLLIKVHQKVGSHRLIECHPWYYWLGDYSLQHNAVRRWVVDIMHRRWLPLVRQQTRLEDNV